MKIIQNFDLTEFNSYRINSFCETGYFPDSEKEVVEFFTLHKDFILLGSGHNIILSKQKYELPFLIFNGNYNDIRLNNDGMIEVEAGALMSDVASFALNHLLSGIEIFYDIPSSLGGAVVMNAGASGEEIKDVIVKVRYLDLADGLVKEINNEDINFNYRVSFFQSNKDKIVLKAWLKLKSSSHDLISDKMENIKSQRWAKQPKDFPNAGSVFKRPQGYYVGAIIDELKLKGFTVGGAKISEKHGGFIINFNNATGEDIISIIYEVQKRVYEKFGVDLEIEQRII